MDDLVAKYLVKLAYAQGSLLLIVFFMSVGLQ